jgi:hypothetical protein
MLALNLGVTRTSSSALNMDPDPKSHPGVWGQAQGKLRDSRQFQCLLKAS